MRSYAIQYLLWARRIFYEKPILSVLIVDSKSVAFVPKVDPRFDCTCKIEIRKRESQSEDMPKHCSWFSNLR